MMGKCFVPFCLGLGNLHGPPAKVEITPLCWGLPFCTVR